MILNNLGINGTMDNELQITMLGYTKHQYSTSPAIDHSTVQKRQSERKFSCFILGPIQIVILLKICFQVKNVQTMFGIIFIYNIYSDYKQSSVSN